MDWRPLCRAPVSNTCLPLDILEFPDGSYQAATEVPKRPQGKQSDESGESGRKVFSGPKTVGPVTAAERKASD